MSPIQLTNAPKNRTIALTSSLTATILILSLFFAMLRSPDFVYADLGDEIVYIGVDIYDSYSIEWGDVDADGDLDLAVGNSDTPNQLYENVDGQLNPNPIWESPDAKDTRDIAWGDWDNDGDLDLAVGNYDQMNQVFENVDGNLTLNPAWESSEEYRTHAVAWGDLDSDGDLDLAVGNWRAGQTPQPSQVFENIGGDLVYEPLSGVGIQLNELVNDLAWMDVDNDDDLDLLLVGSSRAARVMVNEDGILTGPVQSYSSDHQRISRGDWDNDGDLDFAIGFRNCCPTAQVLVNDNGIFSLHSMENINGVKSVEFGHWDSDGQIDLGSASDLSEFGALVFQRNANNSGHIIWESPNTQPSRDISWGDMNGDGLSELAVATKDWFNLIHLNSGTSIDDTPIWAPQTRNGQGRAISLGDWDNDGDLDIALGQKRASTNQSVNIVYENVNGTYVEVWESDLQLETLSIAWGDWNQDGQLELATGNSNGNNIVYEKIGGVLSPTIRSTDALDTQEIAWADWDGDGQLELATANNTDGIIIYEVGATELVSAWVSTGISNAYALDWGDIDGDSDPDLAVGIDGEPAIVLENIGGVFANTPLWQSPTIHYSHSVEWGDIDGDGDLDLVVGSNDRVTTVFENENGQLSNVPLWQSLGDSSDSTDFAWGDWDGDGDLDLVASDDSNPTLHGHGLQIFVNQDGNLSPEAIVLTDFDDYHEVVWADYDLDGDLDLFAANNSGVSLFENWRQGDDLLPNNPLFMAVDAPYDSPVVVDAIPLDYDERTEIPITYRLYDREGDPVTHVEVFYAFSEAGPWYPAVGTEDTQLYNLSTGAYPTATITNTHVFTWDTFASGFFGSADRVVLRFEAHQLMQDQPPGTFNYFDSTPGPFQRPSVATATTLPFRVRGTQLQVFTGTATLSNTLQNALVMRQADSGSVDFEMMGGIETPYLTDSQGYLTGRGEIGIGDQLVALYPVTVTDSYTLYHTSATVTETGFADVYTVQTPGVQSLVVSADNPLVVFDLDISLEWDARRDNIYLTRLANDIQLAAERLYDLTDGQATLGTVRIHHNQENWLTSHIQIYATNNMRPNADLGGHVTTPMSLTLSSSEVISNAFLPGQVRMPHSWNRYGTNDDDFGRDWSLAFAHELAHYFLFIPDNYLGIDENGRLIQTDCRGSVMTDAYRYSEFLPQPSWQSDLDCLRTVGNLTTGWSDWETIGAFYPFLNTEGGNNGPSTLPLALTNIIFIEPDTSYVEADVDLVTLVNIDGATLVLPAHGVQAYQFESNGTPHDKTDDRIIPLGGSLGGHVQLRNGHDGDGICVVYQGGVRRTGCNDSLDADSVTVVLALADDWHPDIVVDPVLTPDLDSNSEADPFPFVTITVTQAAITGDLYVQLFPTSPFTDVGNVTAPITRMVQVDDDTYRATIELDHAVFQGHVKVWVAETHYVDVTAFYFGGGWGPNRFGWGPNRFGWGSNRFGWGPNRFGWGVARRPWNAPIMSGDGQVTLFDIAYMYGETPPYILQSLPAVPNIPSWFTEVGDGYRLTAPDTFSATTSILFSYLQRNVPTTEAFEQSQPPQILYSPDNGVTWTRLETTVNMATNQASALVVGDGLYVLTIAVFAEAFPVADWYNVAYTVQTARPITEALASLDDNYTTVAYYNEDSDAWQIYDRTVEPPFPPLVNTLTVMGPEAYWIHTTAPISWYLPIDEQPIPARTVARDNPLYPPATYYGWVTETVDFTLEAGQLVTATIDGHVCGTGVVSELGDRWAYVIQVSAESIHAVNGCGLAGREVQFAVAGVTMAQFVSWDNSQAHLLSLEPLQIPTAIAFENVGQVVGWTPLWGVLIAICLLTSVHVHMRRWE